MNTCVWLPRLSGALALAAITCASTAADLDTYVLRPNKPLNAAQLQKFESNIQVVFKAPEVDRRGRTFTAVLNDLCGTATEDRLKAITALNSGVATDRVRVPACVHWTQESVAPLPKNSAPITFARGRNAVLASIPVNASALQVGTDIHLRNLTSPSVSLALADTKLVNMLSVAMAEYDVSLMGGENPGVEGHEASVDVEPVPLEGKLGKTDREQCDPPKPDWPYSISEVVKVLRLYKNHRAKLSFTGKIGPAIAFVADTGLPKDRVADFALHQARLGDSSPPEMVWGRNVALNATGPEGNPRSPDVSAYAQAEHGLAVASVASGRDVFIAGEIDPHLWVNLFIHSVLFVRPGYVGSDVSAFENSLSGAIDDLQGVDRIPIINISWAFDAKTQKFEDTVEDSPALLVVAAGNNGALDVAFGNSYPAVLGKNDNVIVVAGHGKNLRKLSISAGGQDVVSISAPGCALPILRADGTTGIGHGTSVAAPLVTFTASIVHALGVQRASEIKERILMTADHEANLDAHVIEGRMLNVPHAIAVGHDLIRWNGSSRLGLLQAPPKSILIGESTGPTTTIPWTSVSRLRVQRAENGDIIVIARVKTKSGYLNRPVRPNGLTGLKFTNWEGEVQQIPEDASFEVVPRARPVDFDAASET